jgi:hypothetical protein
MFRALLLLGLSLILVKASQAQYAESLRSDRPGQSMSPFTVGEKAFQIQAGYGFARNSPGDFRSYIHTGDFQLRLGILERVEVSVLGLASYSVNRNETINFSESSFDWNRIGINARANLYEGKGAIPAIGLDLGGVAIGNEEGFPAEYGFRAILSLSSSLSELFSLTANLAYQDKNQTYATINLGYSPIAELSTFVEYVQFFQDEGILDSYVNFGGAWLFNPDFQVDFTAGFLAVRPTPNLSTSEDYFYLQAGFTKRFNWR